MKKRITIFILIVLSTVSLTMAWNNHTNKKEKIVLDNPLTNQIVFNSGCFRIQSCL